MLLRESGRLDWIWATEKRGSRGRRWERFRIPEASDEFRFMANTNTKRFRRPGPSRPGNHRGSKTEPAVEKSGGKGVWVKKTHSNRKERGKE